MTGPKRAMMYRLAAETGLRARELRSLTPASFDLAIEPTTVTVEAAYSKHRRKDVLPLRLATAADLAEFLRPILPAVQIFGLPAWVQPVKILKPDLEAAGIVYRAERRKGQSEDGDGAAVDFHALRHTFVSNLLRTGADPKTMQGLARHSTFKLTMDVYAHAQPADQAAAVAALPDLSPETCRRTMRQTGTDALDAGASGSASGGNGGLRCLSLAADGRGKPAGLANNRDNGEGDGARTRNLRIDNPML